MDHFVIAVVLPQEHAGMAFEMFRRPQQSHCSPEGNDGEREGKEHGHLDGERGYVYKVIA